ncbi:hypothetical protein [Devosia lacusdianchii]|uniref:hypothetical protein n=1 Tax=Devosia lacusdianchii TaxID=2917991 RepID=UPI001F05081A|nr:hypothetical protein [Devosia sp. JXJ CY 41]
MLARATFFVALALTAPAFAEEIACEGAFAIDSSEARLIEIYGADNVETGIVPGPEGTEMLATTVFPGDPRKALQFVWWDEDNLRDPGNIELPSKALAHGGVHIGTTLAELEAINGEAFTFNGFGWDYGGFASFRTGALSNLPGGCHLSVGLFPHANLEGVDTMPVNGDVEVKSTDPLLDLMDVRVDTLSIGYPHPDFRD